MIYLDACGRLNLRSVMTFFMRLFLFTIFSVGALLGRFPADTPPADTPPADTPPPILEGIFALVVGFDNTRFFAAETAVVSSGAVRILWKRMGDPLYSLNENIINIKSA